MLLRKPRKPKDLFFSYFFSSSHFVSSLPFHRALPSHFVLFNGRNSLEAFHKISNCFSSFVVIYDCCSLYSQQSTQLLSFWMRNVCIHLRVENCKFCKVSTFVQFATFSENTNCSLMEVWNGIQNVKLLNIWNTQKLWVKLLMSHVWHSDEYFEFYDQSCFC